jgi:hypothetical protein
VDAFSRGVYLATDALSLHVGRYLLAERYDVVIDRKEAELLRR